MGPQRAPLNRTPHRVRAQAAARRLQGLQCHDRSKRGNRFRRRRRPDPGCYRLGRFAEDLSALLGVLGETARDLGAGVLILVDELQEAAPDELKAINTAVHPIGQPSVPFPVIFIGAGLPSLPAQLAEATSYAERLYDYRTIGLLSGAAARDALVVPTQALGVAWHQVVLPGPSTRHAATHISFRPSASTFGTTPRQTQLVQRMSNGG